MSSSTRWKVLVVMRCYIGSSTSWPEWVRPSLDCCSSRPLSSLCSKDKLFAYYQHFFRFDFSFSNSFNLQFLSLHIHFQILKLIKIPGCTIRAKLNPPVFFLELYGAPSDIASRSLSNPDDAAVLTGLVTRGSFFNNVAN